MEEMKTAIEEYMKILDEFVRGNEQRGYSLIIWDGKRISHAEAGRPQRIVQCMAVAIGNVIGNTMKVEKDGIDNLRKLTLQTYDKILDEALSTLGKRLGDEKMQAMAEKYIAEHGTEICDEEEALADRIGKDAESDDGAGEV